MAVATNALTTLETVLDELGLVPDAGPQDARIERLINAASDAIASECGRVFEFAAGVVETVPGFGSTHLPVQRYPLKAITSIAINGGTVAAADYSIYKDGATGEVYKANGWSWTASSLGGAVESERLPGTEAPEYSITYDGGYVTPEQAKTSGTRDLPHDLEDACIALVVSRWRSVGADARIKSEKLGAAAVSYFVDELPPQVAVVLARYRVGLIA